MIKPRMKNGKIIFLLQILLLLLMTTAVMSCKKNPIDPIEEEPTFVRLKPDLQLQSIRLNRSINYAVLLPDNYTDESLRFPVVYLLHGFGDNEKAWYQGGNISFYADRFADSIGSVIFVMPQGYNNYWLDRYNGNYPYMQMLINELVPEVDRLFRTKPEAHQRAVMGYSMGGYGALMLAAKNPETFQTGVSLSMSFRTDEQYLNEPQGVFDGQWATIFGGMGVSGSQRLTDHFIKYSPFHFFETAGDPSLSGQNYFIDCGDDEETLTHTANALHSLLGQEQVAHEFRIRNGGHSWDCWHAALPEAFSFMRHAFDGVEYPQQQSIQPEILSPSAAQLNQLTTADGLLVFNVMKPANYDSETRNYPVVYVLNDAVDLTEATASTNLLAQLNQAVVKTRLPACIIVEIPFKQDFITTERIEEIVTMIKANYRTNPEGKYAVLMGNNIAGKFTFELMESLKASFNAALLFNATLADDAFVNDGDVAWYVDMTDEHAAFKGYETLYQSIRTQQAKYEYRVRQGQSGHADFQAGLDAAMVFIKDNLKK